VVDDHPAVLAQLSGDLGVAMNRGRRRAEPFDQGRRRIAVRHNAQFVRPITPSHELTRDCVHPVSSGPGQHWTAMRLAARNSFSLQLARWSPTRGARRKILATGRGALRAYQGAEPVGWFLLQPLYLLQVGRSHARDVRQRECQCLKPLESARGAAIETKSSPSPAAVTAPCEVFPAVCGIASGSGRCRMFLVRWPVPGQVAEAIGGCVGGRVPITGGI